MKLTQNKPLYADLALVSIQAIWGLGFVLAKTSLHTINPVTLLAYEFILSSIILGAYLLFQKQRLWGNFKQGFILGLILWISYMAHIIGLLKISASDSAFIGSLSVVLVPIIGLLIFHTRIGSRNIAAVLLALAGVWILTGGVSSLNWGDMLTFLTALSAALHILYTGKYVQNSMNAVVLNFQQLAVVGILSGLTMIIFRLPVTIGGYSVVWTILYLALFADLFAYLIQTVSQKYTTPTRVSLIFTLQPIFTALFAWIFHAEGFAWSTIIGGGLIVMALIISEISGSGFIKHTALQSNE